eukprot:4505649-Heterocapsa_arctica.AAC.2
MTFVGGGGAGVRGRAAAGSGGFLCGASPRDSGFAGLCRDGGGRGRSRGHGPPGFAHGWIQGNVTLEIGCIYCYVCDNGV